MHLIVPFAAPGSEGGRQALAGLQLPNLGRLLGAWRQVRRDEGDEWVLSPPHERALAAALGWRGAAGCLPWAARAAGADGIDVQDLAWGLVTPCHWHVGTDQVSLLDPATLALDEPASRALFDAVQPLFADEGWALHWGAPLRWYATHESLAGLATASLDRVIGRNVDVWLGEQPAARRVRRLQAEVQMLWHTHPANAAREALGLLAVNSFWLSGCGVAQVEAGPAPAPLLDDTLRAAALAEDWAAWQRAWAALDAGPIASALSAAAAGTPAGTAPGTRLTLCGERTAVHFEPTRTSLWRSLRARLAPVGPQAFLETL